MKIITSLILSASLLFTTAPCRANDGASRTPDTSKPMVALTFDDGPNKNTITVLDALEKNGAVATFFVLGEMAAKNPEILKRIYDGGNEIGNHSYSHPNLKRLSLDEIKNEFDKTDEIINYTLGIIPRLARAPGGNLSKDAKEGMKNYGITSWTVDTLDWKYRDTERLKEYLSETALKDGDIILMHDIHATTAAAVDEVIKILRSRGFELVTVSELEYFGRI